MRKSVIEPANALNKKLFEISGIVSSFANKENNICQYWINWLEELEKIFKNYNYTQCAEIAGYRASVISFSLFNNGDKRSQKRKQQFQKAFSSVQPVQQLLSAKTDELNGKIDNVRILLRQILIPAKDAGITNYDTSTDFTEFMESLLIQFKKHDQIAPGINNAIAIIGKYDVLRILAEEIKF